MMIFVRSWFYPRRENKEFDVLGKKEMSESFEKRNTNEIEVQDF